MKNNQGTKWELLVKIPEVKKSHVNVMLRTQGIIKENQREVKHNRTED